MFSCAMIFAPALPSVSFEPVCSRMPIGVEQRLNALAAGALGDRLEQIRGSLPQTAVDHHQTVGSGDHHDVAAGAGEMNQVVGERSGGNRGVGRGRGLSKRHGRQGQAGRAAQQDSEKITPGWSDLHRGSLPRTHHCCRELSRFRSIFRGYFLPLDRCDIDSEVVQTFRSARHGRPEGLHDDRNYSHPSRSSRPLLSPRLSTGAPNLSSSVRCRFAIDGSPG